MFSSNNSIISSSSNSGFVEIHVSTIHNNVAAEPIINLKAVFFVAPTEFYEIDLCVSHSW